MDTKTRKFMNDSILEAATKPLVKENQEMRELLAECAKKLQDGQTMIHILHNRIEVLTRALEIACEHENVYSVTGLCVTELIDEAEGQLMREKGAVN